MNIYISLRIVEYSLHYPFEKFILRFVTMRFGFEDKNTDAATENRFIGIVYREKSTENPSEGICYNRYNF